MSQTINNHSSTNYQKKTALKTKEWLNGGTMKKQFTSLVTLTILAVLFGCNSNPVQPPDQNANNGIIAAQNVQLLDAPRSADLSLAKNYKSGDLFTVDKGGSININAAYKTWNSTGTATFNATFSLQPQALSENTYITMTFSDTKLQLNFDPEGLHFNVPATLDYSASGLDLSSVPDGAEIDLFYVNTQSGNFEKMNAEHITYDKAAGTIECKGAVIPHFSEYGFGYIKK